MYVRGEKMDKSLSDNQIQITIALQLQRLQRDALPNLTYENIVDTLKYLKWKKKKPKTLHEAVNDILSLSADEIVQLLSQRAIIDGFKSSFDDFEDLIGGKENE